LIQQAFGRLGPMDLAIRAATAADHAEISDIFRQASLSNAGDRENLLAHPELLDFDAAWLRNGRTRVAVADGRLVGFATTRRTDHGAVELDDLFVEPAWMRRGIGRALVADAVAALQAEGAERLEVSANSHALTFYESVGFVADGTVETRFGPTPRMHLDLA